jgi:hypothetical protein
VVALDETQLADAMPIGAAPDARRDREFRSGGRASRRGGDANGFRNFVQCALLWPEADPA